MRFRKDARLDPSQVEDYRGRRAGGLLGGMPVTLGGGSGLVAIVVLVAVAVVAGCGDDSADEPASLDGTSWVLADGIPLPQDVAVAMPTVVFTATEIAGSTGCNRYGGSYSVVGDTIDLGLLAMTNVACPAPVGTIEAAFVAALGDVEAWGLDGSDLVLRDADGVDLLRFEPS